MKNIKYMKQITAAVLCAVLLGSAAIPAYAESVSNKKQEVVYAMADASGRIDDIEVVNVFSGGDIADYGNYSTVKVLNTTDTIHQNGDKISISSNADKVYYQGTMNGTLIPWNISIRYFLDGKEYSASEIAGKSGKLEIWFSISRNMKCAGSFYEDYALQTSFTLNTDTCTNIVADGATLANVGSNKQISYTILPGKGIDAVIRADVTDFEMAAVSVNGIRLDLNVEIDDEELRSKVDDIIDAVTQLDDGAVKLNNGTEELLEGSSDLKTGASSLHSGSTALDEGILALQDGLHTVQNGLNSLNMQASALVNGSSEFQAALKEIQTALSSVSADEKDLTELAASSGKIKQAISDLNTVAASLQANYEQYNTLISQNGLNLDELAAGNAGAVETITDLDTLVDIVAQIPEYTDAVEQYKPALQQMKELLCANNIALGGMETYLNGISGKIPALTGGLAELNTQYEAFDSAIGELIAGLNSMTGNLSALADGINQLVIHYEKLDSGIEIYTDGVVQIVAGYSQVMNGVASIASGSKELVSGSGKLYDGTAGLYDGVAILCDGTENMAEGTTQFCMETTDMTEKMEDGINSVLDSIGGSMENPVSFVSSKNSNVESVQFVIKTAAIEKTEAEVIETVEPERLNFWQKLLKLFGL